MAKRYQPPKEFERTVKKPKLDITINRCPPAITKYNNKERPAPSTPTFSDNYDILWDDDDDDVILLATQNYESQAASNPLKTIKTTTTTTTSINTGNELTFSEFVPNAQNNAATSTQWQPTPAKQPLLAQEENLFLSQVFEDENDDDFTAAAMEIEKDHINMNKEIEFKMPQILPKTQKTLTAFKNGVVNDTKTSLSSSSTKLTATAISEQPPLSQSQMIRLQTSEREIKYLMERIESLKVENKKLNGDAYDLKTRMETKEGEVSLLRDELRYLKQKMHKLKMEKMLSAETAKTECKTKIDELSKQVAAKDAELQLKSVECSVLKMRHLDETRRFEQSMRFEPTQQQEPQQPPAPAPSQPISVPIDADLRENFVHKSYFKNSLILSDAFIKKYPTQKLYDTSTLLHLNECLFTQSIESRTTKTFCTVFQIELDIIQILIAQINFKQINHKTITELEENIYIKQILESTYRVFKEFWTYVHSLRYPKGTHKIRNHNYKFIEDDCDIKRITLQQPEELFSGENVINLRRYVAALSIICEQLPNLSVHFILEKQGEYFLLQIANEAIHKLGFSTELIDHFGVLEAFANLLHRLLLNLSLSMESKNQLEQQHVEIIVGFLKELIFIRPSPWIFQELSFCLMHCLRWPAALELFCVNSPKSTFTSDRLGLKYRFTHDSCLLQIYASLLEVAFSTNTKFSNKQFELMTVICENHVRFIFHCFVEPPEFITKMLSLFDDEEGYENENEEEEDEDEDESKSEEVTNVNVPKTKTTKTTKTTTTTTTTTTNESNTTSTTTSSATELPNGLTQNVDSDDTMTTCECYTKLCLGVVTLIFLTMRQWLHFEQTLLTKRMGQISRLSVQLFHIIFCDNYLLRLFRNEEETTKFHLQLICNWWAEYANILDFSEIQMNFLRKLQESHLMPRPINDIANLQNIESDLDEWQRLAENFKHNNDSEQNKDNDNNDINIDDYYKENDDEDATADSEKNEVFDSSDIMKEATNEDIFFECFKGYAFNFE